MKRLPFFECRLVRNGSIAYEARESAKTSEKAKALAGKICQQFLEDSPVEQFGVITLDAKLKFIGFHIITKGVLDSSLVHPREVFRPAILQKRQQRAVVPQSSEWRDGAIGRRCAGNETPAGGWRIDGHRSARPPDCRRGGG